jgi:hypothetical protein
MGGFVGALHCRFWPGSMETANSPIPSGPDLEVCLLLCGPQRKGPTSIALKPKSVLWGLAGVHASYQTCPRVTYRVAYQGWITRLQVHSYVIHSCSATSAN